MWVPYQPAFQPGWRGLREPALNRISKPTKDRLAFGQSGQGHQTQPVRPVLKTGQTGLQRQTTTPPVRQVYKPRKMEEVQRTKIDPERTTDQDVIQIGSMDVSIEKGDKRPVVIGDKVETPVQKESVLANDHEASGDSSNSKYFLPRWCPPNLTRTQRRKLQHLRFQEKKEKELEKQRDEIFNQYRPMVP